MNQVTSRQKIFKKKLKDTCFFRIKIISKDMKAINYKMK